MFSSFTNQKCRAWSLFSVTLKMRKLTPRRKD